MAFKKEVKANQKSKKVKKATEELNYRGRVGLSINYKLKDIN